MINLLKCLFIILLLIISFIKRHNSPPWEFFTNLDFTLAVLLISKGPKDTKTAVNSAHVPVWVCILTRAYTLVLFATTGENSILI